MQGIFGFDEVDLKSDEGLGKVKILHEPNPKYTRNIWIMCKELFENYKEYWNQGIEYKEYWNRNRIQGIYE